MQTNTKLYKSQTDKALFGVCGGIAEYFKVDSLIVRLLFVLFTLMYGAGLLFYIIAALVIPSAPVPYAGGNTGEVVNSNGSSSENAANPAQYIAQDGTKYENIAASPVKSLQEGASPQPGNTPVKTPAHPAGKTLGLVLIGFGALIMLQVFLPWIDRRLIVAICLIFAGFVFVSKKQN